MQIYTGAFLLLKLKDGLVPNNSSEVFIPKELLLYKFHNLLEGLEDARGLDESILQEGAQIAVCWSRAWGSGGAAATAFHARSTQVSKTTETGESLSRGSFVVRGQRNWHRNIPLEMAIGLSTVNGVPLPLSGIPKTISRICKRWIKITPGREKKESIANKISKATGLAQRMFFPVYPQGIVLRRTLVLLNPQ